MRKINRRRKIIIVTLAVIVAAATLAVIPHKSRKPRHNFGDGRARFVITGSPLGTIGPDYRRGSAVVSNNFNSIAYVARRRGKYVVVHDGRPSAEYQAVMLNKVWGTLNAVSPGIPTLSPDGKRMAFGVRQGQKWLVVVDGKEGHKYDEIKPHDAPVRFSPDGKHMAYAAARESRWFWVIDHNEQAHYKAVGVLSFSPDGARFAYAAEREDGWRIVVDGSEQDRYDMIGADLLVFSDDSKRLAYPAKRADKWVAVLDGREVAEFDMIFANGLTFSPDCKHLVACGKRDGKPVVTVDGLAIKSYWRLLSLPVFHNAHCFSVVVRDGTKLLRLETEIAE